MGTQNFNLKEVDNVVYNNQQVDTLLLNNSVIWQRDVVPPEIPTWKNKPNANTNDITPTWEWNPVSDAASYSYRLSTNGVWGNWVTTTSSYTPTLSGNHMLNIFCNYTQLTIMEIAVVLLHHQRLQLTHKWKSIIFCSTKFTLN